MRSLLSSLLTGCETVGVCLSFPISEAMSQGALRDCELRFLKMRLSWRKWGMPLALESGWRDQEVSAFPYCSGSSLSQDQVGVSSAALALPGTELHLNS